MQQALDIGDIAITTARKPEIPSFKRTTLQNYQAIKLDITDSSNSQSAFVTALDRLDRVDMVVSNVEDNEHKWKSISSARSML